MIQKVSITLFIVALIFVGCKKEVLDNTENPFGGGSDDVVVDSVDARRIVGLHRNIFVSRCANPNCHDGSFEPDFRTIESTYQTLVYQGTIKNDTNNSFDFRVLPGDADASWLVERLITDDDILGKMPLYAVPLSYNEIENVKAWINAGAPDAAGNTPSFPNLQPEVRYFVAYDTSGVRIDTARVSGWSSSFIVKPNSAFYILASIQDDSTEIKDLQVNKLYVSYDKDDFSNAQTFNATHYNNSLWRIDLSTSQFNANQTIYFRYEVKDPDHTTTIFHPNENSPYYYGNNASFIIQ